MSLRPTDDPGMLDPDLIDYDVYDLDQLDRRRQTATPRPRVASSSTGRRNDSWTDPRFLLPLLLFLSAVLVIGMAWRSRGNTPDTAALAEEQTAVEVSDLARRVSEAQLRAGFDGLTITEADGVVVIEGSAADPTAAASIGAVARSVEGTQRVDNRVVVPGGAVDATTTNATGPVIGGGGLAEQLASLGQVTFETGSAELTADGAAVVNGAAALLTTDNTSRVEVHGHTDSDGDDTRNQVLSQERAQAVVDALIARGVDPARLTAVGFGESKPIEPNITAEGRAVNRRIEFLVLG